MDPRAFTPHFHDLKLFSKSAAHYRARVETAGNDTEDKPVYRFGRLTHAIVLGVGEVNIFKGDRRAGKAWEDFSAGKDPRTIYKADEVTEAERIAAVLRTHPVASELLDGEHEIPVEWTMLGRKVATRGIDTLNRKHRRHVELKTTNNAHPLAFQRGALRYGYHAQCAMYDDAARSLGVEVEEHYVVAVETAYPFPVTVHRVAPRLLDEGRKLVRSWMEMLKTCEESDEWPGYTQAICDWDIVEDSFALIIDGEEIAA